MRDEELLAPECAHWMHDICHGTYEVYVPPWTVPVVTGRCDCPCHAPGAGAAGVAPDGREGAAAPDSR